MKPLAPLSQPQTLLSFDFDGTLHDPASKPAVPPRLFEQLRALRESHQASWGVNTGRSLEYLLEGLKDSGAPFLPDWVVAREREIHLCNADGEWRAHEEWNSRCANEIDVLFESERVLLDRIRRDVAQQTGAQWLSMEGEPAGVIAQSEEEIAWIVSRVEEQLESGSALSWQRNSIYLRFSHRDFHKGSSLSEVARLMSVETANCLAIGDSHNDHEMLDGTHAGMNACPANAIEEIRQVVSKAGGLVCSRSHGDAVIEALEHFFDDA